MMASEEVLKNDWDNEVDEAWNIKANLSERSILKVQEDNI